MGKVAFIFSGQGSQYVGMAREAVENYHSARKVFDEAKEALGYDLYDLCVNGPEEKLTQTRYTQPAILATSYALYQVAKEEGFVPDVVAGLSLGEYTALVTSGVFDFKEALKLVVKRGTYMEEAVKDKQGAMAAIIALERDVIEKITTTTSQHGVCEVANYNATGQIVIGGEKKAVEIAMKLALEHGAKKVVQLNVSGPFHTSLLKSAGEKLKLDLYNITYHDLKLPVYANVDAKPYKGTAMIKELLAKQVSNSVMWEDTIKNMIDDGVDTFIEVGPGNTLSNFVKFTQKSIGVKTKVANIEDLKSLEKAKLRIRGSENNA